MVDILLATYNGGRFLREQLDSIFNQTFTDWHIIVSDDGSTDNTIEILNEYIKKFPDKMTMVFSNTHFGNARDNFFYLMKHANSKYIMFCDQDDYWLPNKIEKTLNFLKIHENGNPTLVYSDLEVVDEFLNTISYSFIKYQKLNLKKVTFNSLIMENVVAGCTMMINSSLKNIALNYRNSENIIMHDWWLALIAEKFGNLVFLDDTLIKYRQHSNNSVGAQKVGSFLYILNKFKKIQISLSKKQQQAKEFLNQFENKLDSQSKLILNQYINILQKGKLHRIYFYFKNNMIMSGFLKNIGLVLFG